MYLFRDDKPEGDISSVAYFLKGGMRVLHYSSPVQRRLFLLAVQLNYENSQFKIIKKPHLYLHIKHDPMGGVGQTQ